MLIYGTRGKVISGEVVGGIACSSCNTEEHVTYGILRYFHIFWIPFMVFSKKVGIRCLHCKKTIEHDEINDILRDNIKKTVFKAKRLWGYHFGLIALGVMFVYAMIIQ